MGRIKGLPLIILLTVFLFFPNIVLGASYPSYEGYVNDFAGIMDAGTKAKLVQLTRELEARTGAELAVVSVKSLEDKDIETYSNELFKQWEIGKAKEDNGVLLLVALNERKVRIEVGYGLEGVLPDGKTGRILDQRVIPYFKESKYGQGVYEGAQAIAAEIYHQAQVSPPDSLQGKELTQQEGFTLLDGLIILLILSFTIIIPCIKNLWRSKCPQCRASLRIEKRVINSKLGEATYYCSKCGYNHRQTYRINPDQPPRGGSGWGGSSSGGGGFGGGSSGGGGSSRSW